MESKRKASDCRSAELRVKVKPYLSKKGVCYFNVMAETHFMKYYKNPCSTVFQKENYNFLGDHLKVTEYFNITDKEFKIIMKKFNKLQENTERQLSEVRNKINE